MADMRFETADVTGLPAFHNAQQWLASADARAAAKKLLHQFGLGANPDDVAQDALVALWRHLSNHPNRSIDNVPAYCQIIMRNVVIKAAQGFGPVGFDDDGYTTDIADISDQPMPEVSGTLIDDLRSALEARPDSKPWVTAAALNYITLAAYPSIDTHRAPAPQAGASPAQARMWPSLWFAGQRQLDLFPNGGKHSTNQRKRLSRSSKKIAETIALAKANVTTTDRHD